MTEQTSGPVAALIIGGLRPTLVDILVILALAVLVISAVGMISGRNVVTRLHFLAPVTTLALPLFGIAAMIDLGPTLGSAAVAVSVAAAALSAPMLTTSIARLITARDGASGRSAGDARR